MAVDQLPSVVDLPEWTQHDSRNYEYRGVQFRLEPVDEFHTQTLRLHKELSVSRIGLFVVYEPSD